MFYYLMPRKHLIKLHLVSYTMNYVIVLCVLRLQSYYRLLYMFTNQQYSVIGYEPADFTVHPPPSQSDRGSVHFFRICRCLVPPIFSPKEKVYFVGNIRTRTPKNVFFVITTQTQFQQS